MNILKNLYNKFFEEKDDIKFKSGDVVIFEPKNFNPSFWDSLSEEDRIKYYGPLGYGSEKPKLFVYITDIMQGTYGNEKRYSSGHCVLIDMDTNEIQMMRHPTDFRLATDDEF
jgi:hypothetical protein